MSVFAYVVAAVASFLVEKRVPPGMGMIQEEPEGGPGAGKGVELRKESEVGLEEELRRLSEKVRRLANMVDRQSGQVPGDGDDTANTGS